MKRSLIRRVELRSDEDQSRHEVVERSRVVEKSGLAREDKFRNAGDVCSQYDLSLRHGLHQNEGKTLAAASQHNHVRSCVE